MKSNSSIARKITYPINKFLLTDFGQTIPPFLVSRILIIAIGFFSYYFQPSLNYPMAEEAMRGYGWTSIKDS